MKKLNFPFNNKSKAEIADLHTAFKKLKFNITDDEIIRKQMGRSTNIAIRDFQKKHELPVDAQLNKETISALNTELFDMHHSQSKLRTKKLHDLLEKTNIAIPVEERKNREVGEKTRDAIKLLQRKHGLNVDGKIGEAVLERLNDEVVRNKYSTKTQKGNLHKALQKVSSIAKLDIEIDPNELKEKELGTTSKNLIKSFQEKYKLPATGEINKATLDKLTSVAASKGIMFLTSSRKKWILRC